MKPSHQTRRRWLLGLACLWLAGGAAFAADKGDIFKDYEVKAAFLYNFTKFTDWPARAFANDSDPIILGIVGEDPFGKALDDAVSGEVVRGHALVIKRLRAGDELRSCHVVFISRSEKDRLPAVVNSLQGHPVLTVCDISNFAQQGGMVNLVLVNNSVKMEINQAAADAAGLQISSKLLKLAAIVKTDATKANLKP